MADTHKILGQQDPVAATLTALYTVPASTQAVVNVFIANRSAVATSFRVSVAIAGAADANQQYLAYDVAIAGTITAKIIGISLGAADVIRCYATLATLSFVATGVELTV